jgi:hypothetical protein
MTHPPEDSPDTRAQVRRNLLLIASYLAILLLIAGVYAT